MKVEFYKLYRMDLFVITIFKLIENQNCEKNFVLFLLYRNTQQ